MRLVFATISKAGICDEKGRESVSFGFRGKVISKEDKPISSLLAALYVRVEEVLGWSSPEAARADFDKAIKILTGLKNNVVAK